MRCGPTARQLVLTIGRRLACLANRFPRTQWAAQKASWGWFLFPLLPLQEIKRLMDHEREHGCDNIWEEVNVKGVGKPMYNIETRRRR